MFDMEIILFVGRHYGHCCRPPLTSVTKTKVLVGIRLMASSRRYSVYKGSSTNKRYLSWPFSEFKQCLP